MKYSQKQMADALIATKGQITLAARKLGCSYNTMRSYIDKYPDLQAVMQEQHEQMGDAVELALYDEAVNKRNVTGLIFLAKTKFKGRGYTERIELQIDGTILVEFVQAMQEIGEDAESILRRMIEKAKQKANAPNLENK